MNTLAGYKIREIRELIRKKKISPVEILRIYRKQAERVNHQLNALVGDRFDQAFLDAKNWEEKIYHDPDFQIPPLACLPFTCKEMIESKDLPFTLGLNQRKGQVGQQDASVIKQLKSQGGLFVGVTNVPELGFWFETDNLVYGRTNNPFDLQRTSGGSSGGEAALISAGGSAFGVGSDIGGSIRIPALFCGLFGHKATRRTIPFSGHYPMVMGEAALYKGKSYPVTSLGPLARSADDLIEVFKCLQFQDGIDQEIVTRNFSWDDVSWRGRKVFILPTPEFKWAMGADQEMQKTVKLAAHYFDDHGAQIETLPSDIFKDALYWWFEELAQVEGESLGFKMGAGSGSTPPLLQEWMHMFMRKPRFTFPLLTQATLEKILPWFERPSQKKHHLEALQKMRLHLQELLGQQNILLLPTHPRAAFFHGSARLRPFDFIYTGVFNALDLPATHVPMGLNSQNIPLGVQVVAASGRDDLTLLAAKDLDTAFGGWKHPSIIPLK